MKLIAITSPDYFVVEHLLIMELFNEGLDILHLRKPDGKVACCERLLQLLPKECREKVVIHDNFEFKKKYDLMGIHLNSRNPVAPSGYRGSMSCTCGTIDELETMKGQMKYVILRCASGESTSSAASLPKFTAAQLRAAANKGLIDSKVYAAGGITVDSVAQYRELGFGGVAVSSELSRLFNPASSDDYKKLVSYFRLLRRATE